MNFFLQVLFLTNIKKQKEKLSKRTQIYKKNSISNNNNELIQNKFSILNVILFFISLYFN
jgi:hypothetical protein